MNRPMLKAPLKSMCAPTPGASICPTPKPAMPSRAKGMAVLMLLSPHILAWGSANARRPHTRGELRERQPEPDAERGADVGGRRADVSEAAVRGESDPIPLLGVLDAAGTRHVFAEPTVNVSVALGVAQHAQPMLRPARRRHLRHSQRRCRSLGRSG